YFPPAMVPIVHDVATIPPASDALVHVHRHQRRRLGQLGPMAGGKTCQGLAGLALLLVQFPVKRGQAFPLAGSTAFPVGRECPNNALGVVEEINVPLDSLDGAANGAHIVIAADCWPAMTPALACLVAVTPATFTPASRSSLI